MKRIITMLFAMTIVISLTAQNNGFNFNKTNDYSQKASQTTDTIVSFVNLEEDAGLIVEISNSEVRHIVTSYCLTGQYKGEQITVCNIGGSLNKKMIYMISWMIENTKESMLIFNDIEVVSLKEGYVDNRFYVNPIAINTDNLSVEVYYIDGYEFKRIVIE